MVPVFSCSYQYYYGCFFANSSAFIQQLPKPNLSSTPSLPIYFLPEKKLLVFCFRSHMSAGYKTRPLRQTITCVKSCGLNPPRRRLSHRTRTPRHRLPTVPNFTFGSVRFRLRVSAGCNKRLLRWTTAYVQTVLWSEPALIGGGGWRQSPLSYRCRTHRCTSCLVSPFVLCRPEQRSATLAESRGKLFFVVRRVPRRVVSVSLLVVALAAA